MQDYTPSNTLTNRPTVAASNVASSASQISNLPSAALTPAVISQTAQAARITDLAGKLIGTSKTGSLVQGSVQLLRLQDQNTVVAYSERKTLFDAILSASQQNTLLQTLSKQPGLVQSLGLQSQAFAIRDAVVVKQTPIGIELKLTPPLADLKSIDIPSDNALKSLKAGQNVKVIIQQVGDQWSAKVVSSRADLAGKILQETTSFQGQQSTEIKLKPNNALVIASVKALLQNGISPAKSTALIEVISQFLPNANKTLATQLLSQPASASNVTLGVNNQLVVTAQLPLAKLTLDKAANTTLSNLPITPASINKVASDYLTLPQGQRQNLARYIESLSTAKAQTNRSSQTIELGQNQILQPSANNTGINSPSSSETQVESPTANPPNKSDSQIANNTQRQQIPQAFIEQVSKLIRQHFVNSAPLAESAKTIQSVIQELQVSPNTEVKALAKQLTSALQPLVNVSIPDTQAVQQVLQLATLPVSQQALTQISPANSLVSGLITLLQIALATKLPQRQAGSSERINQLLNQITQIAGGATTNQTQITRTAARPLQEFSQLEQRHQLLRTLSQTLSAHHYNKLSSAESTIQGNETLFYSLPSYSSSSHRDIELTVKRELEKESENNSETNQQATWQLTMLMEIGELGEMLTKCKLKDFELQLDIYTSTESLKDIVFETLPVLKKRLGIFGLDIISSQCQLGKIPESLRPRPYQLLSTQA